jgi:hypothetical protein
MVHMRALKEALHGASPTIRATAASRALSTALVVSSANATPTLCSTAPRRLFSAAGSQSRTRFGEALGSDARIQLDDVAPDKVAGLVLSGSFASQTPTER